ncbi:MAG: DUF2079 domain-containing protein [Myxococcaceae bacterium]|nr:DUF2079 domain-containing protein [Myxococcaceae bacterium]
MDRWLAPSRLAVVAAVAMLVALLGPFVGDVVSFRHPQIVIAALLAVAWWRRVPDFGLGLDPRAWRLLLVASLIWLEVVGLTWFFAFRVNGVDFSIFDWMLESTHRGRLGYSPIYDVNHFGVHSSFILLLWVPLHELWHSPLWLALSAPLVVWMGIFPLRRLVRLACQGSHGALELAAVLWWVGNPWMGRTLHGGFRPELLLPLLTLWFLVGWIERNPEIVGLSLVALLCTKEDAVLFVLGFVLAATVVERWRWRQALAVSAVSLLWLALYVGFLQARLTGRVQPEYWHFWSDFGSTPRSVVMGMLTHPGQLFLKLATSRWWAFFLPLALLPLRSIRAVGGLLPTVLLLGAANYPMMRNLEGYYPLPLLAFAIFGVLDVWAVWRSSVHARWLEGLVLGALSVFPLVHGGYPRAVPVSLERHRQLEAAWQEAKVAPIVCAQTVLFPHLGYSARLRPLSDLSCAHRPGAITLVHPGLQPEPHDPTTFDEAVRGWRAQYPSRELEGGFVLIGPATPPDR